MQSLHGASAATFALALEIGGYGFDVTDLAPRLVPEGDPPWHGAGVSDQAAVVAGQHVHTAVGMLRVACTEPAAVRTVLQRP